MLDCVLGRLRLGVGLGLPGLCSLFFCGRDGINAGALHGGKAQNARNRAIAAFKDGQTPVLVATDVAARGIHIDDVSLVVHVDPPADPKDYLHRAGRTARRA